ncbi:S-layer homology domain-containing protein [Rubeoparvulum massiliense]|uniref:S-layer homology domain-containing protein n=1 Tax=Rubeoparvulum massiliense TaxID=1631346 RepID=UPI00065E3152|nr:S-layer homology domain-containing protein [Rubeoparvulum massiliense]
MNWRRKREQIHKILIIITICITLTPLFSTPQWIHASTETADMVTMIYLYGGSTQQYIQQIEATQGTVNQVLPNYFSIESGGKVVATIDPSFVTMMHQRGIKVIPYVSNHWSQENGRFAFQNWQETARVIADHVLQYDLDGVNIDIENLRKEDAQNQNLFLAELSKLLKPHHKQLSIAVAAATKANPTGWQGQYDYATIGSIVDYVVIMAYDYHYEGGAPGPVAPLPWVKDSIHYLSSQIPHEKLVLSLPFYGRKWVDLQGGRGIGNLAVQSLIKSKGLTPSWDEQAATPFLNYQDGEQLVQIWYENEQSLQAKLDAVMDADLAGIAAWRLGLEDPTFWTQLQQFQAQANGLVDINGHWAEAGISSITKAEIMEGYPDHRFQPDRPLTRAEAVTLFQRLTQQNIQESTKNLVRTNSYGTFKDLSTSHWAYEQVMWALATNLVIGYEDGSFQPDQALTRAEFAALFARFQGKDEDSLLIQDLPYGDCFQHWALPFLSYTQSLGLIHGFPDGNFHPDQPISRAEVATILTRYYIENPA